VVRRLASAATHREPTEHPELLGDVQHERCADLEHGARERHGRAAVPPVLGIEVPVQLAPTATRMRSSGRQPRAPPPRAELVTPVRFELFRSSRRPGHPRSSARTASATLDPLERDLDAGDRSTSATSTTSQRADSRQLRIGLRARDGRR
jgi:hypothetical protein